MASPRIVMFPQAKIDALVAKGDVQSLANQLIEVQRSHARLVEANTSLGKALAESHRSSSDEVTRLREEVASLKGVSF